MTTTYAPEIVRAARMSKIPGVTIAEACARFDVAKAAVTRARKQVPELTLAELAVAALTANGTRRTGTLDLAGVARWLDYLNHDGSTAADARRLLASVPALVAIDGERWRLVGEFP